MRRLTYLAVIVAAAGCASRAGELAAPDAPADGGSDGADRGPVDAGVDTPADPPPPPPPPPPPSELIELCGALPVTIDDWERCYKKRWCEWQVGCLPLNTYRDVQECVDRSDQAEGGARAAEARDRKRAVEQGRAALDPAAFARCLADTSGALCNTARFSVACATRYTGTIPDGGACYADVDCRGPGATCEASCTDACCLGTCRPKFRLGQACDLGDSCEPGLVCHRTCLSGDVGASCASDRDCDSSAWCNAGRCSADYPPGAACTNPLQCGGQTSCVGLSVVNPSPGACLSISRPGDRCDYFCYGNLYCDGTGVCRELPPLGQSCSGLTPCRGIDTTCSNGQCVLAAGVGASCTSSRGCLSGLFCTSELSDAKPTCVAPRPAGQLCTAPGQCDSYLCSGSAGQPGACLAWSASCLVGGGAPEESSPGWPPG